MPKLAFDQTAGLSITSVLSEHCPAINFCTPLNVAENYATLAVCSKRYKTPVRNNMYQKDRKEGDEEEDEDINNKKENNINQEQGMGFKP